MAQRNRRAARATALTVRTVFAPSRVAGECLSHAYAVAVPPVRRRPPASPDRVQAVAEPRRGGVGR